MTDDWKPVVGWEHRYEVSRDGVVRSIGRYKTIRTPYGRTKTTWVEARPLAQFNDETGRPRVQLRVGACGQTSRYVHDLVEQAWGNDG